nr:transposase, MuDR [Tanacetum cinerariifolium]
LGDKIICDLNKTPDLSQRPPQNCPKCGHSVDGQYCQGCALLRKKFKEDLFTYCIENGIPPDSFKPSNDNTNVVNALQEPFVVKQDPGKNSLQNPLQINHHCCYRCRDSLEGYYKDGNSFTYDFRSDLVHESPKVFDPLPQPPLYSCEFCENDARYRHYCTPQVTFIYPEQLMEQLTSMCDMVGQYIQKKEEEKQIEEQQAAKARYWKIPVCYDDDNDKDYTISITYKEPDNSLSMGDEHLDTIPATESDKLINSSVENLVPNPSESEGEYEYDLMPLGIEEDDYDSERDILILEELLSNDSLSLPENESFHLDIPSSSRPPAKPPDEESLSPMKLIALLDLFCSSSPLKIDFYCLGYQTPIGRPPKKRRKSAAELYDEMVKDGKLSGYGKTITCMKCGEKGHNRRSCKGQRGFESTARQMPSQGVIKKSLVKTKQKGAILELKQRHLKNFIFCYYTPYPAMKIQRINASSTQETRMINSRYGVSLFTNMSYAQLFISQRLMLINLD